MTLRIFSQVLRQNIGKLKRSNDEDSSTFWKTYATSHTHRSEEHENSFGTIVNCKVNSKFAEVTNHMTDIKVRNVTC